MFDPNKTQWRIIWATVLTVTAILMYGPLDDCSWNLGAVVIEHGIRLVVLAVVLGTLLVWRFSGAVVVPPPQGQQIPASTPESTFARRPQTTTASGRFSKAWARLHYVLLLLLLCMTNGFTR